MLTQTRPSQTARRRHPGQGAPAQAPGDAATAAEIRRFAFRQGPGRTVLNPPVEVENDAPTTAALAPQGARGSLGHMLPADTRAVLEALPYPAWPGRRSGGPAHLGHVLLAAFGLQRREPSNMFNDHRVVASVRSKFPVHAFVVTGQGTACYLDPYRQSLVELGGSAAPAELLPPAGGATVLLAPRYTDLPTGYARLRAALTELETGVNLHALFSAADLFGVTAQLRADGAATQAAARLIRASGAGAWGAPVLVTLNPVTLPPHTHLPGAGDPPPDQDARLAGQAAHWSVREAARIAGPALAPGDEPAQPAHGLPVLASLDGRDGSGVSWAQVLWQRTAGRAPKGVSGFTVLPCQVTERCVADLAAFAAVPGPSGLLRRVAERVRISVALQHAGALPAGVSTLAGAQLRPVRTDPAVMSSIQRQFGYPLTPGGACGIRHATAVWVLSADVNAVIADLGPGGWALLQRWCGWVAHGICTASAAHGLFARPARSFDEYALHAVLGLPDSEVPVFIVVCGRTQFAEPALDLRT